MSRRRPGIPGEGVVYPGKPRWGNRLGEGSWSRVLVAPLTPLGLQKDAGTASIFLPGGAGWAGRELLFLVLPDSPHQLLEGFVHIEAQLGRGLKVGHVVGGAKGRGFRSGDLGGGQQEESGVCTQGGAQLWEGGRKTHYTL